MLTRVIFNQKGGVGKSSIAVNLAAISASQGLRTLLIDLDSQCNATQYLLGEQAVDDSSLATPVVTPNIETFFAHSLQATAATPLPFGFGFGTTSPALSLAECVHATPFERLSIIPASPALNGLLSALESKHKIYKLKESLAKLTEQFDRVYIDTPPAFNFFTLSALIAGDRILVPFDCDVFSKRALQSLVQNVVETQQDHNSALFIEGIVVNQFDPRANLPKQVVETLQTEGYSIFSAKLSPSVLMKASHGQNLPLIYLDNKHKLTKQYIALFDEIEGNQ